MIANRQREDLGRRLREARKKSSMKQTELASKLGLKSASVCQWESGKISPPPHRLKQITDILEVSHGWLLGRDELVQDRGISTSVARVIEPTSKSSESRHPDDKSLMSPIDMQRIDKRIIAYQGRPGAYSHLACLSRFPNFTPQAYPSFEDCFTAVETGEVGLAMIPIENSLGGRVADIHHILPHSALHIVDEHFQPVRHMLWGLEGARLSDIKKIMSHTQALMQCRHAIRDLKAEIVEFADTAGACEYIAKKSDNSLAALASPLAGETYGLQNLRQNMEDRLGNNVTRFIVMSRLPIEPDALLVESENCLTSFIFTLRSLPAALYKCLGGFATNGVNFVKLESYIPIADIGESASFYAEIEGHAAEKPVRQAFEELFNYAKYNLLGTFPKNSWRQAH